jgi:hypothetical protein
VNWSVYKLEGLTRDAVLGTNIVGLLRLGELFRVSPRHLIFPALECNRLPLSLITPPHWLHFRYSEGELPACDVYGSNPENVTSARVILLRDLKLLIIFCV